MLDIQTFLPPPPGVELITAWADNNGGLCVERFPLVCIKAYTQGGFDNFDAMGVNGDCLSDSNSGNPLERALLLADGRVEVPQMATYKNVDDWLAAVRKCNEKEPTRPGPVQGNR
jgi:hypothetical protein